MCLVVDCRYMAFGHFELSVPATGSQSYSAGLKSQGENLKLTLPLASCLKYLGDKFTIIAVETPSLRPTRVCVPMFW